MRKCIYLASSKHGHRFVQKEFKFFWIHFSLNDEKGLNLNIFEIVNFQKIILDMFLNIAYILFK